jgi:NAD(P)-dependent dehydrogenase (short-subunit alcohol dehydrogenase family)
MDPVQGKVAFVTGGASGIGLGLSKVLVRAGMQVVIADVREDHLTSTAAHFIEAGHKDDVLTIKLDVTDRAAYARAAEESLRASAKCTCWSTMPAWASAGRSSRRAMTIGTGDSA